MLSLKGGRSNIPATIELLVDSPIRNWCLLVFPDMPIFLFS